MYVSQEKRETHILLKNFGKYKQDFANSVYLWEGD